MRRDFIRNQSLISAQQRLINAERIEWKDAMNFDLKILCINEDNEYYDEDFMKLGECVSYDILTLMPKPIKVKPRQNCMTASGTGGYCHANVRELVNRYGGKMITGYELYPNAHGIKLNWHSVWQTPEGKMVDVTQINGNNRVSEYLFVPICLSRSNLFPNSKGITPVLLGKTMKFFQKGTRDLDDSNAKALYEFTDRNAVKKSFYTSMQFAFTKTDFDYGEKENESHFNWVA